MRHFIGGILGFILIILIFIFVSNTYIYKYCDSFSNKLYETSYYLENEDWNKAKENIADIKHDWQYVRKLWCSLIKHHDIDNIDILLIKISRYIELKNIDLSFENLDVLMEYFRLIKEEEHPHWYNIL